MKGKATSMKEIRNIIHRLRMGETHRKIHRDLGVHRSIIKKWHHLSIAHQWLDEKLVMPSDGEIMKLWHQKSKAKTQTHRLDAHREQLEQWNKEGLTSIVIH